MSSVNPLETVKHRTQAIRAEPSTSTKLHKFMPIPSNREWVYPGTQPNRLWTGVGRFGANMLCCGLPTSDSCDCGADHITSGRCPIYCPPEGINSLIDLVENTRVVSDGTCKKNL